ncbi:hypothetical protein GYMLUDRAFT_74517 [Collybiopsis luxurians FD-317 M1]|uniref:Phosphoribosyltransferase domain-containing protein n=1 Tax=Collybiopsis luxurians FD-317 M1 TaxID=944289 RepID=A0A0D0B710_9AGAR|nr:hypothetical protein GYMLUDRAFT_74517 [Collybiopsis luxurians FD-317 M1]
MVNFQLDQSTVPNTSRTSRKPIVIGLYGLPGSGKTSLINQLKESLSHEDFQFYEGSVVISDLIPGGLENFRQMDNVEKTLWRERAIDWIMEDSTRSGRVAVVAGHFMFWDEPDKAGQVVWTAHDEQTYTHILYLDVPPDTVAQYRLNDRARARSVVSQEHLRRWQDTERDQLRLLCLQHGILFANITPHKAPILLRDIHLHTEDHNLSCAQSKLDDALSSPVHSKTMLVFDGDKTLIADDTGELFWKLALAEKPEMAYPLKEIFSSRFGYSYAAFRQVAMRYEEVQEKEFNNLCERVASAVTMHPEIVLLLTSAAERNVEAVVITCGLRLVWEKILEKAGLSTAVKVIGGGRIEDGLVITGEVKGALVARLRQVHHIFVCAFGDSVLDLPMLKEADRAIVAVGEEQSRSHRMDAALARAIDQEGLRAEQVLLPGTTSPRLDLVKLPVVDITDSDFIESIVLRSPRRLQVFHATNRNAAKLLMTPMRNANIEGPLLRQAHQRVGWYLATEFLSQLLGVELYSIPHVQGRDTDGYRFRYEAKTTIVALMRGGEPMALGLSDALPLAMFVHAKQPEDVKRDHLQEQETVILVDSVVNSGKTVVEFVQYIRALHSNIRIVVVAGVIQARSVSEGCLQVLSSVANLAFIALRLSENKFTGKGTTDTGNRLFNTKHLQ